MGDPVLRGEWQGLEKNPTRLELLSHTGKKMGARRERFFVIFVMALNLNLKLGKSFKISGAEFLWKRTQNSRLFADSTMMENMKTL